MSDGLKPQGRVLMVVTAVSVIPGSVARTGFFLEELTHPYLAVHEAGYQIDIASIPGGPAPIDPHSDPREPISKVHDDIVSMGFVHSPEHVGKLSNTIKLRDADLAGYDAIFFAGGAGAIFDFPQDSDVQNAIRTLWDAGAVVSTVCHGSSALLNVKLANGRPLVEGLSLTGLSSAEEDAIHEAEPHFTTPVMMEEQFPLLGARFRKAPPNQPLVVTSANGRLVTGQNPASGTAVGDALVKALRDRAVRLNDTKDSVQIGVDPERTVKILAVDQLVPGATLEEARPHNKAEAAHAWSLMRSGIIRENYLRVDGKGAVSILECASIDEARRVMEQFPLFKSGLITFEFYELGNFNVLEALFAHVTQPTQE